MGGMLAEHAQQPVKAVRQFHGAGLVLLPLFGRRTDGQFPQGLRTSLGPLFLQRAFDGLF